jgi:hypothetical protein
MSTPRTITFLGKEVTVPFIGGRRLVRIGAAAKELATGITVPVAIPGPAEGDPPTVVQKPLVEVIQGLPPQEYPRVILAAFQSLLDQCVGSTDLTQPERLVYGTLGDLVGLTAEEVADAPLDDLTALCMAVYEQEQASQAGKWLIHTLQKLGQPTTPKPSPDGTKGGSTDTTTPSESDQTLALTGAA